MSDTPTLHVQPDTTPSRAPSSKGSIGVGYGIAWAVFAIGHVVIFMMLGLVHLYVYGLIPMLMLLPEQGLIVAALVLMHRGQWRTGLGLLLGMASALLAVAAIMLLVVRTSRI